MTRGQQAPTGEEAACKMERELLYVAPESLAP